MKRLAIAQKSAAIDQVHIGRLKDRRSIIATKLAWCRVDRSDEFLRVGMLRVAQNILRVACFDQHAVLHHGHPIRDFGDDAKIMGHK